MNYRDLIKRDSRIFIATSLVQGFIACAFLTVAFQLFTCSTYHYGVIDCITFQNKINKQLLIFPVAYCLHIVLTFLYNWLLLKPDLIRNSNIFIRCCITISIIVLSPFLLIIIGSFFPTSIPTTAITLIFYSFFMFSFSLIVLSTLFIIIIKKRRKNSKIITKSTILTLLAAIYIFFISIYSFLGTIISKS